mmetsp:Transcript_4245/g.5971  ORF Transcript_4245/g.5971 Transcript_4245/m.5971 type:complete len:149 (+) Transcript_4245:130-576(+)|eukprot:CAMPEP_0206404918 /NCGR_PEP_ID=MMETSP0294-20121207/28737_1 /ASSEMBLY_ACC=CAM_ASM_000327 /TAXON_ID=39354 /ORGANISM="Heterosigma akashiwo, Strain CCMP2393" /LENGTH=148 /DNA_ID=CAMNT_0053863073 /DNA_START=29 /DNA_END=475 /DNA_ORIENTATION=+
MVDPQVFGVWAPFPFAFLGATTGAVLAGLLMASVTDNFPAFIASQIITANICAGFIGSRLGPIFEEWYFENKATPQQKQVLLDANPDVEKQSLLKGDKNNEPLNPPPRNTGFKLSLLGAIILGNVGGAICGGAILDFLLVPGAAAVDA